MKNESIPKKKDSPEMFNRIAKRYDFLNRVLSFGLDIYWRRKVMNMISDREDLRALDLATGTGDLLIEICKRKNVATAVGVDPSSGMLERGWEKLTRSGITNAVLQEGRAEQLPFLDNDFDVVTMGFGIRNVEDVDQSLKEIYRVLKPGGMVLILEFSLPSNKMIRTVNLWYLRKVMPKIGSWISGDKEAYRYLNKTIESFPYGQDFVEIMQRAGFSDIDEMPLTFGAVTIYQGKKD